MDIKKIKYEISNEDVRKCPAGDVPEYAFIGRSNVGKSSLINMLARNKNLAKTSQKPGKTLLINHFNVNDGEWYLVDLPGYGFALRGKEQRDKLFNIIQDYILERPQLNMLFVLIDIRHDPQKIDIEFMDWLEEHDIPFAIVFTKADKLGPVAGEKKVNSYLKELKLSWQVLPPYFITSSEKAKGRDEILKFIEELNKAYYSDQNSEETQSDVTPIQ